MKVKYTLLKFNLPEDVKDYSGIIDWLKESIGQKFVEKYKITILFKLEAKEDESDNLLEDWLKDPKGAETIKKYDVGLSDNVIEGWSVKEGDLLLEHLVKKDPSQYADPNANPSLEKVIEKLEGIHGELILVDPYIFLQPGQSDSAIRSAVERIKRVLEPNLGKLEKVIFLTGRNYEQNVY